MPNYVNPVHWYDSASNWVSGDSSSDDEANKMAFPNVPNDQRPVTRSNKTKGELMDSLAADRDNAKYSQQTLNRDGAPTRPLTPSATPSASSAAPAAAARTAALPPAPQVAASPIAAPAPAPVASPVSAPQAAAPAPIAQPVAQASAPAPAPVRAVPAAPETLEQVFARRLAEQQGTVSSSPAIPVAAVSSAPAPLAPRVQPAVADAGIVQLIPPGRAATRSSRGNSGVHSLADYVEGRGGASFRVGAVAFGEGTAELGGNERARLRDLAAVLKKGASVRIVGASSSSRLDVDPRANRDGNMELAAERAENVARELVRLGVSSRKIYAGAATDTGRATLAAAGEDMTEIYIDY